VQAAVFHVSRVISLQQRVHRIAYRAQLVHLVVQLVQHLAAAAYQVLQTTNWQLLLVCHVLQALMPICLECQTVKHAVPECLPVQLVHQVALLVLQVQSMLIAHPMLVPLVHKVVIPTLLVNNNAPHVPLEHSQLRFRVQAV